MSYGEGDLQIRRLEDLGETARVTNGQDIAISQFGTVPREIDRATAVDSTPNASRFVEEGIYLMTEWSLSTLCLDQRSVPWSSGTLRPRDSTSRSSKAIQLTLRGRTECH